MTKVRYIVVVMSTNVLLFATDQLTNTVYHLIFYNHPSFFLLQSFNVSKRGLDHYKSGMKIFDQSELGEENI